MALDKVKPLKLESVDTGGDSDDEYPNSLSPESDHVECAGIVLDDPGLVDETTVIWRETADMLFKDQNNPWGYTLTELAQTGGAGADLGKAIFKVDGGLVYDSHGHPCIKVYQ